ncbi:PTS sugar transporter subunit IIA [Liquorilactobacillus sicerae]|uniref:PTS sugar transporter subunit IIA n=1 Tax=Liquorilactobacillus sicerae TaxID=1416943 RepID=UPI002481077C|nr:PTS sugar transporter subunit IIA [Liquorilactobacillus sicerae]
METKENQKLFVKENVFISNETSQEEVFQEVAQSLLKKDLVKNDFLKNLLLREKSYPTGIDLTVVDPGFPNVAIPHTEGEFVNTRQVIPVKLQNPIRFFNMIDPEKELQVSFLFMILNNDPEGQANVLAQIMNFLTTTPKNELKSFFKLQNSEQIFNFLDNNFK